MVHEFQQSGCLCAAKRTGRPWPWANSKTQNAFLSTVNAIFRHDYPLAVERGNTPRPLVQKKTWRDSLPIDMLLSAVSASVVAQSSSEIPEGLMNNPVYFLHQMLMSVCWKCNLASLNWKYFSVPCFSVIVTSFHYSNFTPQFHSQIKHNFQKKSTNFHCLLSLP